MFGHHSPASAHHLGAPWHEMQGYSQSEELLSKQSHCGFFSDSFAIALAWANTILILTAGLDQSNSMKFAL